MSVIYRLDKNWVSIEQTILTDEDYKLVFEYELYSSEPSHIAIDDISIIEGVCRTYSKSSKVIIKNSSFIVSNKTNDSQRRKRRQLSASMKKSSDISFIKICLL